MFKATKAFSSFSVDSIEKAKQFYSEVLGLEVKELPDMGLELHIAGSNPVFVYPKEEMHVPATFTVLNFPVDDINKAIEELTSKGVSFEQYPDMGTDEKGIVYFGERSMSWFKDPAGNILSIIAGE